MCESGNGSGGGPVQGEGAVGLGPMGGQDVGSGNGLGTAPWGQNAPPAQAPTQAGVPPATQGPGGQFSGQAPWGQAQGQQLPPGMGPYQGQTAPDPGPQWPGYGYPGAQWSYGMPQTPWPPYAYPPAPPYAPPPMGYAPQGGHAPGQGSGAAAGRGAGMSQLMEELAGGGNGLSSLSQMLNLDDKELWKGALIGAAVVLLLTNDSVQNALFKTGVRARDAVKSGVDQVKSRTRTAAENATGTQGGSHE